MWLKNVLLNSWMDKMTLVVHKKVVGFLFWGVRWDGVGCLAIGNWSLLGDL